MTDHQIMIEIFNLIETGLIVFCVLMVIFILCMLPGIMIEGVRGWMENTRTYLRDLKDAKPHDWLGYKARQEWPEEKAKLQDRINKL